jgi:serine/threonine protein kinase
VSAELQRIVRKALTKDRDSRYQSARDLMIDLKGLRRDLDIQSEMKRTGVSGVHRVDSIPERKSSGSSAEADRPAAETNFAETTRAPDDAPARDGSIVYRVAALIAMLILAITAFGLWLYFR